jgi:hypothetical protein
VLSSHIGFNADPDADSAFYPRSGSRVANQCGSRRIRILVKLLGQKRFNCYKKNVLTVSGVDPDTNVFGPFGSAP